MGFQASSPSACTEAERLALHSQLLCAIPRAAHAATHLWGSQVRIYGPSLQLICGRGADRHVLQALAAVDLGHQPGGAVRALHVGRGARAGHWHLVRLLLCHQRWNPNRKPQDSRVALFVRAPVARPSSKPPASDVPVLCWGSRVLIQQGMCHTAHNGTARKSVLVLGRVRPGQRKHCRPSF